MEHEYRSQDFAALDSDRTNDHLLSQNDFVESSPQWGLPRSVSPTSCPPGVTPALADPSEVALGGLRLAPPPRFDERAPGRRSTPRTSR
ncbi:MAG: hypothetical protein JWM10_5274 [Myxococcaceae bacterium]|nr:hypothetical protein [Myxococcaceae bacterium]